MCGKNCRNFVVLTFVDAAVVVVLAAAAASAVPQETSPVRHGNDLAR